MTTELSISPGRNGAYYSRKTKDFGQLVFAAAKQNSGVILIRYPASARSALTAAVLKLLSDSRENLYSCFAVLEPGRVRITQLVI
jgi:hypothetical protein